LEGTGLTLFKRVSEYIISAILLGALAVLIRNRNEFDRGLLRLIAASIALTIVAELAFTFYVSVYGLSNLFGHYFKLVSFYLMYRAIVARGLSEPVDVLFRNLKQSEGALREARDELEERVKQRTAALEETVGDLTKEMADRMRAEREARRHRAELAHMSRVAMMGELGASLAHELNQPLAAILSNAQAAQRLAASETPDTEEIRDALADIVDDGRRAGEVIRRLRALLKKDEPKHEPLEVNQIVGDVVHLVQHDADLRDVSLRTELAETLPPVQGDRVQLQQVLLNLILNGIEATVDGRTEPGTMVIRTSADTAGTVQVAVQDSGTGIDEDELERVFEPFFTTKPGGLGLGLAISRTIVEAHGGRLSAKNNLGGGATFRFSLPAHP